MSSSLMVNPLMPKLATKANLVERTHYSGPSSYIHHGHSSKAKHSVALSALTLLSFLFFLNILQNCLQEHMMAMNETQQVIIVQARTPDAQKRKGDSDLNLSLPSESRQKFETTEKDYMQIPVKLRTQKKPTRP